MDDIIKYHLSNIKNGKKKSMEFIMDSYIDSVYYLVKSIISCYGSKEDCEECVQDIFLRFWKKCKDYDESRGSLKSFILIMAKSEALNKRKLLKEKVNVVDIEEVTIKDSMDIENTIITEESRKEMLDVIKKLEKTDREIIVKRYFYNKKISEISEDVGLSISAVENRIWRAKGKLKFLLEQNKKEVK